MHAGCHACAWSQVPWNVVAISIIAHAFDSKIVLVSALFDHGASSSHLFYYDHDLLCLVSSCLSFPCAKYCNPACLIAKKVKPDRKPLLVKHPCALESPTSVASCMRLVQSARAPRSAGWTKLLQSARPWPPLRGKPKAGFSISGFGFDVAMFWATGGLGSHGW